MRVFWTAMRAVGLPLPLLLFFLSSSSGTNVYNGTIPPFDIDFDTVVTGRLVQLQAGLNPPRTLQAYKVSARSIRGPSQSASDFLHVYLTAYDSYARNLVTTSNNENNWLQWTTPEVSRAPRDVLPWSWYHQRISLSRALSVLHGTEVEGPWSGMTISRLPEMAIGRQDQAFYAFYNHGQQNYWRLGAADGHLYWLWAKSTPVNATETPANPNMKEAAS